MRARFVVAAAAVILALGATTALAQDGRRGASTVLPTEAEITAPVAEDATLLTVGFLLNGSGPGWIDEASLEVVLTEEAVQDDGAPLSDRQVEHLSAFAKLYGYVRWFSPYSEPNAPSWAEIAREGAIDAENAASPEALAAVLRTWFEPLAPGLVIRQGTGRTEPEGDISDASDLVRWQHEGVAFSNPIYQSQRVSAARAETWNADLGAGLAVSLPVTAPRSTLSVPAPGQASPAGPVPLNDRKTRLGAIIIAWNVFWHFYPYFEVDGEAWASTLSSHLAGAATARTPDDFRQRLKLMVADLDDGHGHVGPATNNDVGPAANNYWLPFRIQWVEDALVVTAVSDPALPVATGDVIIAINGQPVADLMQAQARFISASTESHRMMRAAQGLASRNNASPLQLKVQRAEGQQLDVEVTPVVWTGPGSLGAEARPEPITWLPQGTWYFDLTRLDDARLTAALTNVKPDQPVIFDLRGYPRVEAEFLGHLTDEPVSTAPFQIAVDQLPEGRARTWKSVGWSVEPASPRLRARVAFLTDERAISYSETLLAIVKGYGLADIVGEPTAGMNGNVNPFELPGNHRILWTGMRVLNHDGSSLFGRGVLPTVPASPTIEGIRSGLDEVLLTGIDVVTRPQ